MVGPTGVGKTEVALRLAELLDGEIVSADSRLFYRGMDIGTAKPTLQELERIPHHLIDIADPDETWSLAQFQHAAQAAIAGIHARGRLPLLVGGTGQYSRTVTQGWSVPPVEPNPELRLALEAWAGEVGEDGLHKRLAILDPSAALRIDPRNLRRTVRALEVIFTTGKPFSQQQEQGESPYRLFQIGLSRPRAELYRRIDARIEAMFAAGLVKEVRSLLLRYPADLPSFTAIGYREVILYLQDQIDLETAKALVKRQTRVYVRRQANWFKPEDPDIHWYEMGAGVEQAIAVAILSWLMDFTVQMHRSTLDFGAQ